MEKNKKFDFNNLLKGKNLAIVILSGLLFICMMALGNSDTNKTDKLNNTINNLQEQIKTLENDKTDLQTKNNELEKQLQELKTSKEKENLDTISQHNSENIEISENQTIQAIDNEKNTINKIEENYVININTKKIHYPTCSSVKKMKSSNKKEFTGSKEELINNGYEPCQICKP